MPEQIPKPEFSEEELQLIESLKRDPNDPEARRMLLSWTEQQEAEANRINTPRANIEVNLRRARLYKAAGFKEEAWEILEDVRRQSTQEGEADLYDSAMRVMDEMDPE